MTKAPEITVLMVTELAELENVTRRTVNRNKDKYVKIIIPFAKKGRKLTRYINPNDLETLRKFLIPWYESPDHSQNSETTTMTQG